MLKKLISFVLAMGTLLSFASYASAADNSPAVYLNGEKMTFETEPYIDENDRTLVPMRAIFEAIGAQVSWDGDKQTVFGMKETGGTVLLVSLQIGSKNAFKGSTLFELDTAPVIKNDTTFVPLRFVSESLGADVEWDNDNYAVKITVE